jgi:hypothetical protein
MWLDDAFGIRSGRPAIPNFLVALCDKKYSASL